jgi:hypothetical protein
MVFVDNDWNAFAVLGVFTLATISGAASMIALFNRWGLGCQVRFLTSAYEAIELLSNTDSTLQQRDATHPQPGRHADPTTEHMP